ncbi:MAG TPA: RNA polymerase sigma factor [Candidatus Dormibacteraeota bacterium]|jgi:RNA polymerase sigma-70 factor (ECF subfamily)|nr:RNA polymerase sigma factor [Candidatus Dormibacteraeota bacterium]
MRRAAASRADRRDSRLAEAMARDLDGGFEDLVLAYQDRLFAYAASLCGDPEGAEEVVQEAFIRAYRALRGYDPGRRRELALRPWLYRITLNALRNHLRGRRPQVVSLAEVPEPGTPAAIGPEDLAARDGGVPPLRAALLRLPPGHRQAIVLRYVHELSYSEVAQVLAQPVGTVKANVHRGLRRLRRYLPPEVI